MVPGLAALVSSDVARAEAGSPHVGWQERRIEALSAERIGDLAAGRGTGLALAAGRAYREATEGRPGNGLIDTFYSVGICAK